MRIDSPIAGRSAGAAAAVFMALLAACAVKVDYADTVLSCEEEGECPSGMECVSGTCESSTATEDGPDAFVPIVADAGPEADAAPGEPDADPGPSFVLFSVRVGAGSDDAEELVVDADELNPPALGDVSLGSSDLEMVDNAPDGTQLIGLRFTGVDVPQGAVIDGAILQFTTDETDTEATNLHIHGEAVDAPLTFTSDSGNISARLANETAASVDWAIDPWETVGESGPLQRVVIKSIVQELVDRPGWNPGQSMVFLIEGSGKRVAQTYNLDPATAPELRIRYVEE